MDTLFKNDEMYFSYRMSGILVHNGKVLFQRFKGTKELALPGGHAVLGECSEDTIVREFMEESRLDVKPVKLVAVGENFFPWPKNGIMCQQVSLYYLLALADENAEVGDFAFMDELGGESFDLEFVWKPWEEIENATIYPADIKADIKRILEGDKSDKVSHFVFHE